MKKILKSKFIIFLLGMLVMLVLDMIFNFNNSVEKKTTENLTRQKGK